MRATHPPTRSEALSRLAAFVPHAGRDYAAKRNYDIEGHPHVSVLSPYIRHRLITEDEVLHAVLGRFSLGSAEKFIQEVFWRTYWKGWLEMRPGVWSTYRRALDRALDDARSDAGLGTRYAAACAGQTGIAAFDHWVRELTETGYLHNHARMWFASIWIFTLDLPWELGADFFLRHLLDGDPAVNTLSWRWVAGLQTQGKHYLARSSNISKYTEGRFNPGYALNTQADPLVGPAPPERRPAPLSDPLPQGDRIGLILTEDDLSPGFINAEVTATLLLDATAARSPLAVSDPVKSFARDAFSDMASRHADTLGDITGLVPASADSVTAWKTTHSLDALIMPYAPTGPAADALRPLIRKGDIACIMRPYDEIAFPKATAGFFKFKRHIPEILMEIGATERA